MPCPPRMVALVAVILLPICGAQAADDCVEAGLSASSRADWAAAIDGFRAALARPACSGERSTLLFNIASATQNLAEETDDPALACDAVGRYQAYLDADGDATLVAERLAAMKTRCAARPIVVQGAPTSPPPAPDRTLQWALTAGSVASLVAGGIAYGLALDAIDTRDAASDRYVNAASAAERSAARLDFDAASATADRWGYGSYIALGLGGVLAIGAAYSWTLDGPAVHPTPGGVGVSGRF